MALFFVVLEWLELLENRGDVFQNVLTGIILPNISCTPATNFREKLPLPHQLNGFLASNVFYVNGYHKQVTETFGYFRLESFRIIGRESFSEFFEGGAFRLSGSGLFRRQSRCGSRWYILPA